MNELGFILLTIITSGGFGGLVFGLHVGNSYKIRLPISGANIELGFLGDILVGVAASVTIFFVAGALFGLQVNQASTTEALIKMIALGVLSGFTGIRVLSSMSSKLIERISKIDERIDQVELSDRVGEIIRHADFLLSNNPDRAKIIYDKALLIDPTSEPAMIGLAKSLRRMERLTEAIEVLSEVIELNPKAERAYYNRACYKHLSSEYNKKEVLRDLAKAVTLFDFYREYALEDKDFEDIKNDTDYQRTLQQQ